jgi:hypothetical protein
VRTPSEAPEPMDGNDCSLVKIRLGLGTWEHPVWIDLFTPPNDGTSPILTPATLRTVLLMARHLVGIWRSSEQSGSAFITSFNWIFRVCLTLASKVASSTFSNPMWGLVQASFVIDGPSPAPSPLQIQQCRTPYLSASHDLRT